MKSIMEEASSIVKAVEKAWVRAGKPQEFSVKIFEEAQKNFFGLTTKSAKIAIFFDERKSSVTPSTRKETPKTTESETHAGSERSSHSRFNDRQRDTRRDNREGHQRSNYSRSSERPERSERSERSERPERSERTYTDRSERSEHRSERTERSSERSSHERRPTRHREQRNRDQVIHTMDSSESQAPTPQPISVGTSAVIEVSNTSLPLAESISSSPSSAAERWNKEMVNFAENWLRNIFSQAGHSHTIITQVTGDSLLFTLSKKMSADEEKERAFYRNCSHLMMAALRNSFDYDFTDMKIIISSSQSA